MISMMIYAVVKFVTYSAWCFVGLRMLAPYQADKSGAGLGASFRYGAFRWLLGLGFGVAVFVAAGSIPPESVAALYFGIYTPLRIVEWGIVATMMMRGSPPAIRATGYPRIALWIGGGIVVSFLSDLASPQGLSGKFCVGRCLC